MSLTSMNRFHSQVRQENPGLMRQRIPVRRWEEADFAVPLGRKPLAAVRKRRQAQPPAILWQ